MSVRIINLAVGCGDSLSDRGTMYKRLLLGIIPLAKMSGLEGNSADGRFTNQYTWLDHWAAVMVESQYIKDLEQQGYTPVGIVELLLTSKEHQEAFRNSFHLDNSVHVRNYGQEFYETYCEGGATAADWSEDFTWNLAQFATRKIVNTLENERKLFLAEQDAKFVTQEEKDATLFTIFIGANDLITVRDPSSLSDAEKKAVIEKTVAAEIDHIKALINAGYKNFALTNLPNLGLTPRFQKNGWAQIGKELTTAYNQKLSEEFNKLQAENHHNKDLQFSFYDIEKMFNKVYQNPEKYGFDKTKITECFEDSPEFKTNIRHGAGYMFWDSVHPTSLFHDLLQEMISKKMKFEKLYTSNYVDHERDLPHSVLEFSIREVVSTKQLNEIEKDVNTHKNKVVFVKKDDKWSCYRYQEGKSAWHYVADSHYLTLEGLKKKDNKFSLNDQYTLMKLAVRQHWNRGIYFYVNDDLDDMARVIHKPYIPCHVLLDEKAKTSNSFTLSYDHEKALWNLFYVADVNGESREINIENVPNLHECLKDKTDITVDTAKAKELIKVFHRKSCYEDINLSKLLQENQDPEVEKDLKKIFANTEDKQVMPCDETIDFIQSHCQGANHDDDNKYIIEPAAQGFHIQFKEDGPSPDDKIMVQARRGTTVLVYFKDQKLNIGYCGKQGYRELEIPKLEDLELEKLINPQELNPAQMQLFLKRPAMRKDNEGQFKDTNSEADKPFTILNNLIKSNGGFGYDEASFMFDFARAYKGRWAEQSFAAVFGTFFMRTRIEPYNTSLVGIFHHALKNGGERSRGVLIDLGWIDNSNALRAPFNTIPAIKNAYEKVIPKTTAEKHAEDLSGFMLNSK
ncbi:MAG: SGNH/GDSL hydrolase family protein [Tatlockia sp.]|nr:SGNH/GDSL hydrolase family protein [Tatlockia sp.]